MLAGTTEGFSLTQEERRQTLAAGGLVHPHPEAVRAPLFLSGNSFFFAPDKVQTKYEMLRAHLVDRVPVITAAREHGYSRAAFYLVAEAFEEQGMKGLLDDRRGRHGPLKVTPKSSISYARPSSFPEPGSPGRWPSSSAWSCTVALWNACAEPDALLAGR